MPPTTKKNPLEGFHELKPAKWINLKVGDFVRYMVDREIKKGGFVKYVGFPNYLVLTNYAVKASWSVQLKQPELRIWIKTREEMQEKRDEMKEIYAMYKQGKLKPANITTTKK
jgi:hypothetical protein